MRKHLLRYQKQFFASSVSANPSTTATATVYAESLFRKWTPPNTTSIEENVCQKSSGALYREDSFGEFLKPVELMRNVVGSATTKAHEDEDEEIMMTFAGEQVPTWQPKRQLSFATYAGVTDSNLWNEEFKFTSGNRRSIISLDNIWTNKKKTMTLSNSVANYNTFAIKDDPWDTPRCTVP